MKCKRKNDLDVVVYYETDAVRAVQKKFFNMVYDDCSYYISLNKKYELSCHINIFDYGTLSYLIVHGDNVIKCIIFNDQTLDLKTYEIHLKPEHRFLIQCIEGQLIRGKAYLLLKFLHLTSPSEYDTTYLIKIPEMKQIEIRGEYNSIFTPKFLVLYDEYTYESYIIVDSESDEAWDQILHKSRPYSTDELLEKTTKSLKKNGALYRVTRIDISLSSKFIEHHVKDFSVFDYRYGLDKDKNYKTFEEYILENKRYNMEHYEKLFLTWEPINLAVNPFNRM